MRIYFFAVSFFLSLPASAAVQASLEEIEISTDQVVFVLNRPVKEKILRHGKPDRLIVEMPGTFSALAQGIFEGQGRFLAQVLAEQSQVSSMTARTVIELKEPAAYRASWKAGRLSVRLHALAAKKEVPVKPAGAYLIQAGAFSKEETALSFKAEIEPAVAGWFISTTTVKSTTLYRLRAGPFRTLSQAQAAVKKLAAMGEKAVILPIP